MFFSKFKQYGSRIAAALQLAKPAEKAQIAADLNAALHEAQLKGGPASAETPRQFVRQRNNIGQRARSVRKGTQSKFHAKRAGGAALGQESHAQANSMAFQYLYNPLLTGLLFGNGHMSAKHPQEK